MAVLIDFIDTEITRIDRLVGKNLYFEIETHLSTRN